MTNMERRILRQFGRFLRGEGSETLREEDVAGALGVDRQDVSRSVAALLLRDYLCKKDPAFPDYQITPQGIKALKPWPLRYGNEIVVVIIGAIIASFLVWLVKFLIQAILSRIY